MFQPTQPVQPLGVNNNSNTMQATPVPVIIVQPMQPTQPTQYGNENGVVPIVPLLSGSLNGMQGIEMTTPNSSNVPLATAQPITYIAQETFATHITTGTGTPTEYDHKNRIFIRSLCTNVLAIIVFSLFFAKLAWMRTIWLGSYNAAEWSMVKDSINDGKLCSKKLGTSLYGKSKEVFEYTSDDTDTYGNAEYVDLGTSESMKDVCDARCVAEPTCVAYVLTTKTSAYTVDTGCTGCNLALDSDNTIYSSGASEGAQSYTAYKKFKASDSVTAGTTTSTTSTTSTPTPSINITSTFQYLGCYKPPSSLTTALTTDVDYVYTVPFDTSKYKAVPAFDRSLSGYHGWSNPSLFPLYIGCYEWSSSSTLKSSSIDMTDGMTPWKDSVATYDSATECKDLCSKYKYFYIADSKKNSYSTKDSAPVCRCIDSEWSVITSGTFARLDERHCHPSNIANLDKIGGSSNFKRPLKYLIGNLVVASNNLIGAFYKTSDDQIKPIQSKRSVLTYYRSSDEYVDTNLPTSGTGYIKPNLVQRNFASGNSYTKSYEYAYSTPVDMNPTDSNSGWIKLDDKACGYDRRGGLKDQARAIYINPNVIKEKNIGTNNPTLNQSTIDLDFIPYIPMLVLMICFPILIMFYFWTSLASSQDLDYLSNIMRDVGDPNKSSVMEYFEKLKLERCCLSMNIECYHHEQRTTGSGKNRSTHTVKVVTARGHRNIHFDDWWDQTDTPTELERFEVVKVLCKLDPVSFADEASKINVEGQRARFKQEYRNRDRHMSYNETQILNTFKRNILFIKDENRGGKNCDMLTQRMYYIMTALCLNWIYRYWFECAAVRTTVHVSKVIQVATNSMAGQKTEGKTNQTNVSVQLQNLQVAFMNGQISAQVYDQSRQALMAVGSATNAAANGAMQGATHGATVVPVARRPSLSAAEAMKVKKQGSGGCKNKCCCCFLALIFVVAVPLLSYMVFLPCGPDSYEYEKKRWCENNNDVPNPPLFSRTYQELQEAETSSSSSISRDSSIIELNVKVNQLIRTDIEECVNIDTTTDAKTCDGPFSLVNTCVKFEKLSDSGGRDLAITDKGPDGCGHSTSNQCGRCEGDCDNDNDCTGDLKCYQRTRSTAVVPGCSSTGYVKTGMGDHDYCYSSTTSDENFENYAAATEMGCNEVIQSTDAGRCLCGTADNTIVGIEVGCDHLPFTCSEICSKKCPQGGTCTEVPTKNANTGMTGTMAACIVPVYKNGNAYSANQWKLSCQAFSKNARVDKKNSYSKGDMYPAAAIYRPVGWSDSGAQD